MFFALTVWYRGDVLGTVGNESVSGEQLRLPAGVDLKIRPRRYLGHVS